MSIFVMCGRMSAMPCRGCDPAAGRFDNGQGIKQKGRSLPVPDCETSAALASQIHRLNDFLAGFEFEGCDFGGFFRRFNMADQPGFAFNKGGRLYCDDGDSYQQMKKAERLALMINGSSVVEIDINASYLTILHSLKQAPLPDRADIYDIPGLDRRIAKAWLTATLAMTSFICAGRQKQWRSSGKRGWRSARSRR